MRRTRYSVAMSLDGYIAGAKRRVTGAQTGHLRRRKDGGVVAGNAGADSRREAF